MHERHLHGGIEKEKNRKEKVAPREGYGSCSVR